MEALTGDSKSLQVSSSVARYRAALRCANLRRESGAKRPILDRWAWLLPRVLWLCASFALTSLTRLTGAAPDAGAPPPAPYVTPPTQANEGVVVLITKSSILVGDDPTPIVPL